MTAKPARSRVLPSISSRAGSSSTRSTVGEAAGKSENWLKSAPRQEATGRACALPIDEPLRQRLEMGPICADTGFHSNLPPEQKKGARMGFNKDAAQKVLAEIDRNELAQLGCDLTSIPSPTGHEKAIAEFILAWFEGNGLRAVRQDVEVDRPNAVGIVKGDGTGLSLSFNGHMDTSLTGT